VDAGPIGAMDYGYEAELFSASVHHKRDVSKPNGGGKTFCENFKAHFSFQMCT
jgi:hypothetical protein